MINILQTAHLPQHILLSGYYPGVHHVRKYLRGTRYDTGQNSKRLEPDEFRERLASEAAELPEGEKIAAVPCLAGPRLVMPSAGSQASILDKRPLKHSVSAAYTKHAKPGPSKLYSLSYLVRFGQVTKICR